MKLMEGKKGIVFGVSNKRGIAHAIARLLYEEGAEIAFTYFGEAMEGRVRPLAEDMQSKLITSCDVSKEEDVRRTFEEYEKVYGKLDFMIHAVAFANREDLKNPFVETNKDGWDLALGVSAYSLVALSNAAKPLFNPGASVITLSYLGGEKVIPNYNVMGVAKSALESSVRYLAYDLGENQVRVNALSAGPLKTLAAKGISGFESILKVAEKRSPLKRNVTLDDVAKSGLYLLSDLSSGVSGEVLHVDCGFHCVGISKEECS